MLSSRGSYFGEEAEIQEIFSKKSIFHRDFDEKISTFFEKFQGFIRFWSKRAGFCRHVCYFSLPDGMHSSNLDDLSFFYKFQSIFSKNFKNFHPSSNSPLSKPFLSFFDKYLNQIIEFTGNFSVFIGALQKNQILK